MKNEINNIVSFSSVPFETAHAAICADASGVYDDYCTLSEPAEKLDYAIVAYLMTHSTNCENMTADEINNMKQQIANNVKNVLDKIIEVFAEHGVFLHFNKSLYKVINVKDKYLQIDFQGFIEQQSTANESAECTKLVEIVKYEPEKLFNFCFDIVEISTKTERFSTKS